MRGIVRFVAWVCVAIGALVLAGLVYTYVPCFTGVPDTCVSGLLLLFGGIVVLALGGIGGLMLALTRRRPEP